MTSSTAAELDALLEQRFDPKIEVDPDSDKWEEICACGHLRSEHSSLIGGTFREGNEEFGWTEVPRTTRGRRITQVVTMRRCKGQTRTRGKDPLIVTVKDDPEDPERKISETEILSTCECPTYRAVAEVYAPRAKWRQKHPPRVAHGQRDRDPAKHAFARGMKAMRTGVEKLNVVKNARLEGEELRMHVQRVLDSRFRWIDRRCWVKGCKATANVWPAYTWDPAEHSGEPDDRSEMRCPEHRP